MIAIITGDIIGSRSLEQQNLWLNPLKQLFREYGPSPKKWEVYRGDSFQLEISNPPDALHAALRIKSQVKSIATGESEFRSSALDVRMAIGIGEKTYTAKRITESNGPAFLQSGALYERLRKEKTNLALHSLWADFDEEINLCLKLAGITMDAWTLNSAHIAGALLKNPEQTQKQLGELFHIEQNSVSDRYTRSHTAEILLLEAHYRKKIAKLLA